MRWAAALTLLLGCASAPVSERTAEAIDLSGDWNDVDADAVAAAIISEATSAPWIDAWTGAHGGRRPVLRLYPIKNKTAGYIDYRYFTKQIEQAFVRSGRIDVVASLEEAADTREDRADQATHASDESIKSQGSELGSDFILNGWLITQEDRGQGEEIRAFLTSVEIIETETNRKVWMGQKRIKKRIRS